jgi:hypothetical protein
MRHRWITTSSKKSAIVATPFTLVNTAASIQRSRDFSGFLVIENVMSYERDKLKALASPQQGEQVTVSLTVSYVRSTTFWAAMWVFRRVCGQVDLSNRLMPELRTRTRTLSNRLQA